jgi:aspartyl/asparaginyl beta-hydroxylase (cupin superfamily)
MNAGAPGCREAGSPLAAGLFRAATACQEWVIMQGNNAVTRGGWAKAFFHVATRPITWVMRLINRAVLGPIGDYRFYPGPELTWEREFAAALPQIQEEAGRILRQLETVPRVTDLLALSEMYFARNDWRQIMFYFLGERIDDICELYPHTDAALRKVPGLITGSLSFLAPGQSFPAHTHYYKGYVIMHLGVFVAEDGGGSVIRVGDEKRPWRNGETFTIDPVFEHEGWNHSSRERVVLLAEFERPGMPRRLEWLNRLYLWAFNVSPLGHKMLANIRSRSAEHRQAMERMAAAESPETYPPLAHAASGSRTQQ